MSVFAQARKYFYTIPKWRFAPLRMQVVRKLQRFGSAYGGYYLDASMVGKNSVVYSLGIGKDVSFDLQLIERFGASVEGFDPTPAVKHWLSRQTLPEQFHFHAKGIADFDGETSFYLPPREDWISHSLIPAKQYSRESIRVPILRLRTVMRQMGHEKIDVLKMDIEGAEYAVLDDLVSEKIPVGQILVEFHHRLSSIGTERTRRSLALLEGYGMKICHICPRMEVFTLIRMTAERRDGQDG
jgi:FkbM family methyltransferase